MARVNVEQQALTDARFKVLASALGVDVYSALGRMIVIWNQCQETEKYVLDFAVVNSMFDDATCMSEALLKANLAKKHRSGLYICGTKGRIEWVQKKRLAARRNGKKGGRPKETNDEPIKNQRRLTKETPPALALALTLKSKEESKSLVQPEALHEKKSTSEAATLAAFEIAWSEYPRKRGRAAALRAFKAQIKTPADFQALTAAIENYRAEIKILGTPEEFQKHGSGFFNSLWRDYTPGVWKPPTKTSMPLQKPMSFVAPLLGRSA